MSRSWLGACLLLGGASSLLFALGEPARWQLTRANPQLLLAGLAHWNLLHWAGNLLGLGVLALLGQRARLGLRDTAAWLLAGPLALALLLLHPRLPPYLGLSAWLHAGVAVAALALLRHTGRERWIGAAIALGLLAKLLLEQPWGPLLRPGDWWGGATLPLAHAVGAACGGMASVLLTAWRPLQRPG